MAVRESDSLPNENKEIISTSARLRNFSDESKHSPGILTAISDMSLKEKSVIEFIVVAFYGNGNNEDNRGYVSIVFNCHVPLIFKKHHDFNFSCVVAIKDAAGNKKFVRTFTFPYDASSENAGDDPVAVFTIDRYIARETLFGDREDLLPDDQLNLKVDIILQKISSSDNSAEIESAIDSSFEIEEDSDGYIIVLSLNSELAQRFYEESSVFRALCDTPMIESSTGLVRLFDDYKNIFRYAGRIIMKAKYITFNSWDEIIGLYIFADKYDIQSVIRACRSFFKSILHVENSWGSFDLVEERVEKLSSLATFFNDDILRETVDRFLKNLKDDVVKTRRKCEHGNLNLGNLKCTYTGESPYLYFELEEEGDEDRSEFEFYK